jgi:hypothetical protein
LRFGHDLDENGGHVGEGIDGDGAEGIDAAGRNQNGQGDDQYSLAKREFKKGSHEAREVKPETYGDM